MGPAQITNLSLSWFVTIPLIGRDVLALGFGVSTREKPLTVYVPPWYGGKAYALIESTTKGCRLVEISMEYGALVPVTWGVATGQASLNTGIFYMLERISDVSGTVQLRAFVKAAADLSVAGIIQFAGLIYIGLSYLIGSGRKVIRGEATVSVSIKLGFVRISYSFTAAHEEESSERAIAARTSSGETMTAPLGEAPAVSVLLATFSRISGDKANDGRPFGRSFTAARRSAFQRVIAGYRSS